MSYLNSGRHFFFVVFVLSFSFFILFSVSDSKRQKTCILAETNDFDPRSTRSLVKIYNRLVLRQKEMSKSVSNTKICVFRKFSIFLIILSTKYIDRFSQELITIKSLPFTLFLGKLPHITFFTNHKSKSLEQE